ncbi:protein of unknown function UPF0132 [Methanococcus vannielii SB]|jgi:uncharacterized membrane protein|uniref:Chloroplast import component protein (Tic20) n=1 Tax=Methanococcus vannielii (strain ATCC 35089 / DSM 1224 / JCM 13029 / OCM 148 / SB) TaxID=406327 RepID=A6UQI8_METVS|nr:DUF4870 domain-containing protein [Methanococcus vannielii]ABR54760.1 protein of unknown function UPF0132 [Methanococcus vannielii SB]
MTSLGLEENHEAVLAYLLGFVSGGILLVIEKESSFVKFHAMQSIIVSAAIFVLSIVLAFIPIIGWLLGLLLMPASLIIWFFCMFKAYKGEMYKLPVIGDMAEKYM